MLNGCEQKAILRLVIERLVEMEHAACSINRRVRPTSEEKAELEDDEMIPLKVW